MMGEWIDFSPKKNTLVHTQRKGKWIVFLRACMSGRQASSSGQAVSLDLVYLQFMKATGVYGDDGLIGQSIPYHRSI